MVANGRLFQTFFLFTWLVQNYPFVMVSFFDLCGPPRSGESLLILVDACSRWPDVAILRSTKAEVLVRHLQRIFSTHGLPELITSDNGPQFVSKTFSVFLEAHGISHRKVTPYWPQAIAEVGRFNQPLEKIIRAAHIEGKDWQQEIYNLPAQLPCYPARCHLHCPLSFDVWTRDKDETFPAS